MHFDGIFSELGYAMPQVALQALLTVNKPNVMWNAGCCAPTVPACRGRGRAIATWSSRVAPFHPLGSPGSQLTCEAEGL